MCGSNLNQVLFSTVRSFIRHSWFLYQQKYNNYARFFCLFTLWLVFLIFLLCVPKRDWRLKIERTSKDTSNAMPTTSINACDTIIQSMKICSKWQKNTKKNNNNGHKRKLKKYCEKKRKIRRNWIEKYRKIKQYQKAKKWWKTNICRIDDPTKEN